MLFSPKLIIVDSLEPTVKPSTKNLNGWGQNIFIIPREKCSFHRVKRQGKGIKNRNAIRLAVLKKMQSGETKIRIVTDKNHEGSGVWTYELPASQKASIRTLPESLARPKLTDGYHLIKSSNGFEGQIWEKEDLLFSRWWPQNPSPRQWQVFLRKSSFADETILPPCPELKHLDFRSDLPLIELDQDALRSHLSPINIFISGLVIFILAFTYFATQYTQSKLKLHQVQNNIQKTSLDASEIIQQRRKAFYNMKVIDNYKALGDNSKPFLGLANVVEVLDKQDLRVSSIRLSENKLEIHLTGSYDISMPELVTRLENTPNLKDVNTQQTRNRLIIQAVLTESH